MTRLFLTLPLAMLILGIAPAFALDLMEAKTQGLVGEQTNGLIGIVTPPGNAELQALVKTTNAGRLQIYQENAKGQGISLEQMQGLAGQKLQTGTPGGQWIQDPSGHWIQK